EEWRAFPRFTRSHGRHWGWDEQYAAGRRAPAQCRRSAGLVVRGLGSRKRWFGGDGVRGTRNQHGPIRPELSVWAISLWRRTNQQSVRYLPLLESSLGRGEFRTGRRLGSIPQL